MKIRSTETKLTVNLTLDSSETIMFNKGGMFMTEIPPNTFYRDEKEYDKVVLTIQLERESQGRHDWITQEANKAKSDYNSITPCSKL